MGGRLREDEGARCQGRRQNFFFLLLSPSSCQNFEHYNILTKALRSGWWCSYSIIILNPNFQSSSSDFPIQDLLIETTPKAVKPVTISTTLYPEFRDLRTHISHNLLLLLEGLRMSKLGPVPTLSEELCEPTAQSGY